MNTNPEPEEKIPVVLDPPKMLPASKPRTFTCPQCPKAYFLKKYLNDHMKVHSTDNPHVCPLCNKVWPDSYQLIRHVRSHTGEKLFKCSADACGKEFARRYTLRFHMQSHTGEKMEPKPTCAICGTSFAHTVSLKRHNWKFHNPQAKQHPCGTCGKVCVSSTELKLHLETHLPNDPQECPICGTSCRNGLVLKEHVQRHSRQGNYNCEQCLKNFTTKDILQRHIKTVHNGEGRRKYTRNKSHACSFCEAKLRTPWELANHLRTHTGEKPFKCTTCSKAFTTMNGLQKHSKLHTGETPYKCNECGKKFRWWSSLDRHMTAAHSGEQQKQVRGGSIA